jgi:epoxyqueuosine reductase
MHEALKKDLLRSGATVVGFACVKAALRGDISHLERAVSIGVERNLNEDTISLLLGLQKRTAAYLKGLGYRYLCIPPDSDRKDGTYISRLYPLFTHKIAATSAGIGWIGRNGLLISPEYGPRLSLATVLTDAPVDSDTPIESSMCGDCRLCIEFCPSQALTGNDWSRGSPFVEIVKLKNCSAHKKKSRPVHGKPNCGLCITICPYGRKNKKGETTVASSPVAS